MTLAQAKAAGTPSSRGRFLRVPDLIATIGLSRTTIYRLIDESAFPEPERLTKRAVGWWEADVVEWMQQRRKAA